MLCERGPTSDFRPMQFSPRRIAVTWSAPDVWAWPSGQESPAIHDGSFDLACCDDAS